MKNYFITLLAFAAFLTIGNVSAKSRELNEFLGYWSPGGYGWCDLDRSEWETEGNQLILLRENFFFGVAGECSDVQMKLVDDRLKVAAACSEGGHGTSELLIGEFWIDEKEFLRLYVGSGEYDAVWYKPWKKCPN